MIKRTAKCEPMSARDEYELALFEVALDRLRRGLAPPAEIYRVKNREQIDWSVFPGWARPTDPEVFDGCCHEG